MRVRIEQAQGITITDGKMSCRIERAQNLVFDERFSRGQQRQLSSGSRGPRLNAGEAIGAVAVAAFEAGRWIAALLATVVVFLALRVAKPVLKLTAACSLWVAARGAEWVIELESDSGGSRKKLAAWSSPQRLIGNGNSVHGGNVRSDRVLGSGSVRLLSDGRPRGKTVV